MPHVVFWVHHEIMNHLNGFRMLHVNVMFLTDRLHKILVHKLPDLAPFLTIVHNQKMIASGDQAGYDGRRSVAEDIAFLIHQLFDELTV